MDLFLSAKEKTITVKGKISEFNSFIPSKGYIDEGGNVWIYSATGKPVDPNAYPYFWFNDDQKIQFSNPTEETMDLFNERRLMDLSKKIIVENTVEGEELYNEQAINDMNSAAAVYIPIIEESDDFLKKIVKSLIIEKNIDISRLKYRMNTKYGLANLKSSLQNKTKMSTQYFMIWIELLGVDFTIMVEDNGIDTIDPLKEPLLYLSTKDQVVKNSEL